MRRRGPVLILSLVATACGRGSSNPPSSTVPSSTTAPATAPTSTTIAPIPKLTAAPIAGLDVATFHGALGKIAFAARPPSSVPGFVTTTSTRNDATVSTYGRGDTDIVKIVAEADTGAAPMVLVAVAKSVLKGAEATQAEAWLKAALKKGPISPDQPSTASAVYAKEPFDLVVNAATATLSIGRLSG